MRKSLEAISLAALAFIVWITWQALYGAKQLPARIAVHFDMAGNPNGWGTPSDLPLFPVMAAAIYLLMTVVARFPSSFKYPVEITEENRPRLEALNLDLIAWMKMEMVCLFAWVQWTIIEMARRGRGDLSFFALPFIFLVALFGTAIWFIVAMRRAA
ncbi:MAG: DUF1648 domain-containing protein [Terracidiphilus sp.]|jgi:uncharacterized membrane protein